MPGSFSVSDAEIDAELREGSGFQGSKIRIYALYQHQPDAKTVIAFLKEEYGPYYGHSYTYPDGKKGEVHFTGKGVEFSKWGYEKTVKVKWPELEKRLRQMVTDGTYLSGEEKIDYEQLELKYIGTVGGVPMLWESAGQDWSEAVCCDTPEKLFDKLLDSFTGYQEYLLLQKKEQIGEADRQKIQELCERYVEKRKEEEGCDCL